jgi:hypothetical protein
MTTFTTLQSLANNLQWKASNASLSDWRSIDWSSDLSLFCAVSSSSGNDKIATSPDGLNWTTRVPTPTTVFSQCDRITYDPVYKRFYAVGRSTNNLSFSNDDTGLTWTNTGTIYISTNGFGVATNKKSLRLVAAGKGTAGSMAWSDDGTTWTATTGFTFSVQGNNALWYAFQNIWLAAGESTSSQTLAHSLDGKVWTAVTSSPFSDAAYGLEFNPTKAVAAGKGSTNTLAYTFNGKNWYGLGKTIFTDTGYGVVWNGNPSVYRWVAVGKGTAGTLAYSANGIVWYSLGSTVFSVAGYGIATGPSLFVAVGEGAENTLATSTNGLTWSLLGKTLFSDAGYGVAWNGLLFVAVGKGSVNTMAWSTDGLTWNGLGKTIFSVSGNSVAWVGSLWVACGEGTTNTLATSPDGVTWTGIGKTAFSNFCKGLGRKTPEIVAVGSGTNKLVYSSNGSTFTSLSTLLATPATIVRSLAFNGSLSSPQWVAGCDGSTSISNDGFSWTTLGTTVIGTNCLGVGYSPSTSTWVACGLGTGNGAKLAASTDGISWLPLIAVFTGGTGGVLSNQLSVTGTTVGIIRPGMMITGTGVTANTTIVSGSSGLGGWGTYTLSTNNTIAAGTTLTASFISNTSGTSQGNGVAANSTGRWVLAASGANRLCTSTDGFSWKGVFATFIGGTGGASSTTLTVSSIVTGTLASGCILTTTATDTNSLNTNVVLGRQLTGTAGSTGTYQLNSAQTIANGTSITTFLGGTCVATDNTRWVSFGTTTDSTPVGTGATSTDTDGLNWDNLNASIKLSTATTNSQTLTVSESYGGPLLPGMIIVTGTAGNPYTMIYRQITGQDFTAITVNGGGTTPSNTINITAITAGTFFLGTIIAGTGVPAGTKIIGFVTGTGSTGVYTLSNAFYVPSTAMTGSGTWGTYRINTSTLAANTYWVGYNAFPRAGLGVTYANNLWIGAGLGYSTTAAAVGYAPLAVSTNGLQWTPLGAYVKGGTGNVASYNFVVTTVNSGTIRPGMVLQPLSGTNDVVTIVSQSVGQVFTGGTGGSSSVTLNVTLVSNGTLVEGTIVVGTGVPSNTYIVQTPGTVTGNYILSQAVTLADGTNLTGIGTVGTYVLNREYVLADNTDTFAYSAFTTQGNAVAYSPTLNRWVAVGEGTNSLAYSDDGYTWTGLGQYILLKGRTVTWNGSFFLAGGESVSGTTQSTCYSYDGINWMGVGANYSTQGTAVAYNSKDDSWVSVGSGSNTICHSRNGVHWTGLGIYSASNYSTTFATDGKGVAWQAPYWVAAGSGSFASPILRSRDGLEWTSFYAPSFTATITGSDLVVANDNVPISLGLCVHNGTARLGVITAYESGAGRKGTYSLSFAVATASSSMNGAGTENVFIGGVSGTTLTVSSVLFGNLQPGMLLGWTKAAPNIVPPNVRIVSQSTNTTITGGTGNVSSTSLNVSGIALGTLSVGMFLSGTGVTVGTYIVSQSSGSTGSTGTYVLSQACTIANATSITVTGSSGTYTLSQTLTIPNGSNLSAAFTPVVEYTGSATTTVLTVTAVLFGTIQIGMQLHGTTVFIQAFLSGNGGTGTYVLSASNTLTSATRTMYYPQYSSSGYGACWAKDRYVTVGETYNTVVTSSEGLNWRFPPLTRSACNNPRDVLYNSSQDKLVMVGSAASANLQSQAGSCWWDRKNQYVAVGAGTINSINQSFAVSPDGKDWASIGQASFTNQGNAVRYANGTWMAAGQGSQSINWSPNGKQWLTVSSNIFTSSAWGVAYSPSLHRWVAVGKGNNFIGYSDDNGLNWIGLGLTTFTLGGRDVLWNGSYFVAVGENNQVNSVSVGNTIAYSPDGIVWSGVLNSSTLFGGSGLTTANGGNGLGWNGATFFGNTPGGLSSTKLVVTDISYGVLAVGMTLSGPGIAAGTKISSFEAGTTGNLGTYNLDTACTVPGGVFIGGTEGVYSTTLVIRSVVSGTLSVGTALLGTTIASQSTNVVLVAGTGNVASTTLNVNSVSTGSISVGLIVTGTGVPANTYVTAFQTGTGGAGSYTLNQAATVVDGTNLLGLGGVGLYTLTNSVRVTSASFTANTGGSSSTTLSVTALGTGTLRPGMYVFGTGVNPGTFIVTGSGGVGSYTLSEPANVPNLTSLTGGTYIYSSPITGTLTDNKMVAVGTLYNAFTYSTDNGVNWRAAAGSNVFSENAYCVAWCGAPLNKWFAGGKGTNTLAFSTDGIVWYGGASYLFGTDCYGLFWDGSKLLGAGDGSSNPSTLAWTTDGEYWYANGNATIAHSSDEGDTWTSVPSSVNFATNCLTVACNEVSGRWVAAGSNNVFHYSDNGQDWGNYNQQWAGGVKWVGGTIQKFIAAANNSSRSSLQLITYSSDGKNWFLSNTGGNNSATFDGGKAIAASTSAIMVVGGGSRISNNNTSSFFYRSTNGTNWTFTILPYNTYSLLYVGSTLNKFFGFAPRVSPTAPVRVLSSSDGLTWTATTVPAINNVIKAAWSGTKLCALGFSSNGANAVMTSTDGVTWTVGNLPALTFSCIEWSSTLNVFCALGNSSFPNLKCIVSTDGLDWYITNNLNTNNLFQEMVWNGSAFCGVGRPTGSGSTIYISTIIP